MPGNDNRDRKRGSCPRRKVAPAISTGPLAHGASPHSAAGQSIDSLLRNAAAHAAVGDFRDAAAQLQLVLQQDPSHPAAATQLAEIETDHGLHANAVARLLGLLRSRPRYAPALSALARNCVVTGRLSEALDYARRACALAPSDPGHRLQYARVLLRMNRLAAACDVITPMLATGAPGIRGLAHGLMAEVLEAQADPAALEHFRTAVELLPDDADHHMSYGIALLQAGHLPAGWDEYEWRHRTVRLRQQALTLPDELRWNGQDLRGRTIVVTDEQGIGDAIQFFRYMPMLAARGPARLIHVSFSTLMPLFRTAAPFAEIVDSLPFGTDLHYHSTTLSLARVFGTRLDTIPAPVPYLFPEPARTQTWRVLMKNDARPRIGLVWSGNPTHQNDAQRSIKAEHMLRLTQSITGTFYSLQKDVRSTDAAAVTACASLRNIGTRFEDFADTAAAIAELDLVITVDTAVAHLAGALGKPVWVLLPRIADWRWLRESDSSPWYPTARLFRAGEDGWPQVIDRVAAALVQADLY